MKKIVIDPDLADMLDTEIDLAKIKEQIIRTSIVAWNSVISESDIDVWLENFDGSACGSKEIEQKLVCWILLYFTYFTEEDIDELCGSLYRKYIHEKISDMNSNPSKYGMINDPVEYIVENTLFLPMGNPSESGGRILYNFRTKNDLPKESFEKSKDFYENVVLLDDLTITGEQASSYVKKIDINYNNLYFATFFATRNAIEQIKKVKNINLINVTVLDDRTRAFHDSSFVFSHNKIYKARQLAYEICEYYGDKVVNEFTSADMIYMKNHPLGFGNSQQLIGFNYNTPDNVLPILWGDTLNWNNIFKRTFKKHSVEGSESINGQYI